MFDRTMLTLGAFKLDAVVLAPGETSIEEFGERAIAVIPVSGKARCNGVELERWRHLPVTSTTAAPEMRREAARPPHVWSSTARGASTRERAP